MVDFFTVDTDNTDSKIRANPRFSTRNSPPQLQSHRQLSRISRIPVCQSHFQG